MKIKQSMKVILGLLMFLALINIGNAKPDWTYRGTITYFEYEKAGNGNMGYHMGIDTNGDGVADVWVWIDPNTISPGEMNIIRGVAGGETIVIIELKHLFQDVPNCGLESIVIAPVLPIPPSPIPPSNPK